MLKVRVVPVLYLMNGLVVRSEGFRDFKAIGNPVAEMERYGEWLADELVYLDITRDGEHDFGREDHKFKGERDIVAILRQIAASCFMPLAFGGRVRNMADVDRFIRNGADKVVICSQAYREPALVTAVAEKYGAQAMVVGIDVKREDDGQHRVYIDQGRSPIDEAPEAYARRMEVAGAGEILLNSIDRDGAAEGYDVEITRRIADAVSIPVVACGGVGDFSDFRAGIDEGHASAVAAGNIFHFTEMSYKRAKRYLKDKGYGVRYPYPG